MRSTALQSTVRTRTTAVLIAVLGIAVGLVLGSMIWPPLGSTQPSVIVRTVPSGSAYPTP